SVKAKHANFVLAGHFAAARQVISGLVPELVVIVPSVSTTKSVNLYRGLLVAEFDGFPQVATEGGALVLDALLGFGIDHFPGAILEVATLFLFSRFLGRFGLDVLEKLFLGRLRLSVRRRVARRRGSVGGSRLFMVCRRSSRRTPGDVQLGEGAVVISRHREADRHGPARDGAGRVHGSGGGNLRPRLLHRSRHGRWSARVRDTGRGFRWVGTSSGLRGFSLFRRRRRGGCRAGRLRQIRLDRGRGGGQDGRQRSGGDRLRIERQGSAKIHIRGRGQPLLKSRGG